jgi:hypothetical protein
MQSVVPDIDYARSGDVAIAYQTVGDGPDDLVFVRGFAGDLLSVWEQPLLVRFIEELASFTRVTMIDSGARASRIGFAACRRWRREWTICGP